MADFKIDFPTLGELGDAWITQHMLVPQGMARGRAYEMAGWQYWCHANRYRVREDARFVPADEVGPGNPPLMGEAFTYQRTLVVGPQKTGKGPYSAAQVAFEAAGPSMFGGWARGKGHDVYRCADNGCSCGFEWRYESGEPMGIRHPSPLIQIGAFSEDQARNIYSPLKYSMDNGPLKKLLAPRQGFTRILGLSGGEDSDRIDVVTSAAKSRLGNPISDAEQDEAGLYTKSNGMNDFADTQARGAAGMGGRTHLTTNAWDPTEGSYAQKTYESGMADTFVYYRNPDLEPSLLDERGHPISFMSKANRRRIFEFVYEGSWWVNLNIIESEAMKLISKGDPTQAERFFGNRLVQGMGSWLTEGAWSSAYSGVAR